MITAWTYWALLAVAVPVYWLLPDRVRLRFLATVSFSYLLSLTFWGTLALLLWSLGFYYLTPRRPSGALRWATPTLTLGILGYLAYSKYIPPLIASFGGSTAARVAVPLGLSYFTFKLIHYTVEERRGNIERNSIDAFLGYMFLFPIFTAGPIERYDHYLNNVTPVRGDSTVEGLTRIGHGLIKQFAVNRILILPLFGVYRDVGMFLDNLDTIASWKVWVYLVVSLFSVYLDFSAYSDLAIGSARLFGIRIMENFNWPLLAPSIGEFWKRWHMTLSGWCQAYVYLPTIGLTRNPWIAIYAAFSVIGLWHAGSLHWLGWGLYHATGVSVFVIWRRYRLRRGWRFPERYPWRLGAMALTVLFAAGGGIAVLPYRVGDLNDSVRLLGKALFLF